MSNLTDEGLDLSQRTITESIFQGPDLDTEGEELLTGKIYCVGVWGGEEDLLTGKT